MILTLFRRGHARWTGLASAYLDGELSPRDLARFERHLPDCAQCREALDDAEAVHSLLSTLPEVQAPRSFALTPELIAQPARGPVPNTHRRVALHLAQGATAVAIVAFATILSLDLAGAGSSHPHQLSNVPEAASQPAPPVDDHGVQGAPVASPTVAGAATPSASPATAMPSSPPTALPSAIGSVAAQGQDVAPREAQAFGAQETAGGAEAKRAVPRASTEFDSAYREATVTAGWYRPAEIALAAIALLGLVATVALTFRGWRNR